jgi:KDO2-lipid IV(A) lauroyltransferase
VLYTAHYGNWEWLAFLPLSTPYTCTAFYQPLKNKYFDTLVKAIRERFGVQCIPSKNGYKTLMQKHQKGELTINYIISDQSPQASASKHWVRFLNQDTAFLIGSERMAKRMQMAVVYPEFKQPKRGVYEITFKTIAEDASATEGYAVIDEYARLLEENIQQDPSLWLWSHRRWKLNRSYDD